MHFDDLIYFLRYTFRIFFFGSFWIYSIIYFICKKVFEDRKQLKQVDEKIIKSIPIIGVIWIIISILSTLITKNTYQTLSVLIIYSIYLALFWLFRTRQVKDKLLYRIILSFLFYISYETFDLLAIIISKGSIPKTWLSMNISGLTVLGDLGVRFLFFILTIVLYSALESFFKKAFSK